MDYEEINSILNTFKVPYNKDIIKRLLYLRLNNKGRYYQLFPSDIGVRIPITNYDSLGFGVSDNEFRKGT